MFRRIPILAVVLAVLCLVMLFLNRKPKPAEETAAEPAPQPEAETVQPSETVEAEDVKEAEEKADETPAAAPEAEPEKPFIAAIAAATAFIFGPHLRPSVLKFAL